MDKKLIEIFFKPHMDLMKSQISSLYEKLNKEEVTNVIQIFRKHPRIIFCTLGKKAIAVQKIIMTAQSFGLDWHNLSSVEAFHGNMGIVKKGDLLVFVSKSGETEETNKLAKYFQEWDSIAITSEDQSEMVNLCNHKLIIPVGDEGSPFSVNAPFISTFLYLGVLHSILIDSIETVDFDAERVFKRSHPGGEIGKVLNKEKHKIF